MTTETVTRGAGRPTIPLDWQKIDEDLEAGCCGQKIADSLGINRDTLYDRVKEKYGMYFTEYSAQKQRAGDDLLRKAQFDKAIGRCKKGDTTLLMHLGRVRLKQVEAQPERNDIPPSDANLNFADAFIRAEAEKSALAKKVEELEKKIEQLSNYPTFTVTCKTGSDDTSQSEANPIIQ